MTRQIPRGDPDLKCPLWKKTMDLVCHTCPWWQKVRGKNPQSREEVDRWDCAIAWLPMLLLENAQRQIQTAASVDKVATEVQSGSQRSHETTAMLTGLLNRAMDIPNPDYRALDDHSGEIKRVGHIDNGGGGER